MSQNESIQSIAPRFPRLALCPGGLDVHCSECALNLPSHMLCRLHIGSDNPCHSAATIVPSRDNPAAHNPLKSVKGFLRPCILPANDEEQISTRGFAPRTPGMRHPSSSNQV